MNLILICILISFKVIAVSVTAGMWFCWDKVTTLPLSSLPCTNLCCMISRFGTSSELGYWLWMCLMKVTFQPTSLAHVVFFPMGKGWSGETGSNWWMWLDDQFIQDSNTVGVLVCQWFIVRGTQESWRSAVTWFEHHKLRIRLSLDCYNLITGIYNIAWHIMFDWWMGKFW